MVTKAFLCKHNQSVGSQFKVIGRIDLFLFIYQKCKMNKECGQYRSHGYSNDLHVVHTYCFSKYKKCIYFLFLTTLLFCPCIGQDTFHVYIV